jgi:hypothetical protein
MHGAQNNSVSCKSTVIRALQFHVNEVPDTTYKTKHVAYTPAHEFPSVSSAEDTIAQTI